MAFGRYRQSPLASNRLADNLHSMRSNRLLTADVHEAADIAPFWFDPVAHADFYREMQFWGCDFDQRIASTVLVLQKFRRWFDHKATPMERAYLAIAALTDSYDQIEQVIDDVKWNLTDNHKITMVDGDDTIFKVTDYHAVRDPFRIRNALNTPEINWWCDQFEFQAQRVAECPPVEFAAFQKWDFQREQLHQKIRAYFQRDPFSRFGVTKRRARKVVRRSYDLMRRFYGDQTTRDFLKGKPLKLRGYFFDWEFKIYPHAKRLIENSVSPSRTHTPFSIVIRDHDGHALGSACVLFEKTPMLDQAVAIGLCLSNREDEFDLLNSTNIFGLTRHGVENPMLRWFGRVTYPRGRPYPDEDDEEGSPFENRWTTPTQVVEPQPAPDRELPEACPAEIATEVDGPVVRLTIGPPTPPQTEPVATIHTLASGATVGTPDFLALMGESGLSAYREYLEEELRFRYERRNDPIVQQIRGELFRRLEVPSDELAYMEKPEVHFSMMPRVQTAPRLAAYISRKEPLHVINEPLRVFPPS